MDHQANQAGAERTVEGSSSVRAASCWHVVHDQRLQVGTATVNRFRYRANEGNGFRTECESSDLEVAA